DDRTSARWSTASARPGPADTLQAPLLRIVPATPHRAPERNSHRPDLCRPHPPFPLAPPDNLSAFVRDWPVARPCLGAPPPRPSIFARPLYNIGRKRPFLSHNSPPSPVAKAGRRGT